MIDGVHAVIFTEDADADRAFFRDVLELPSVDAGAVAAGMCGQLGRRQGGRSAIRALDERIDLAGSLEA